MIFLPHHPTRGGFVVQPCKPSCAEHWLLLPGARMLSSCSASWVIYWQRATSRQMRLCSAPLPGSHDAPLIAAVKGSWRVCGNRTLHLHTEVGGQRTRRPCNMNTYLPRQHGCCRGSERIDAARGVPTLSRDAHCTCGWQQNSQGRCYHPQALPPSTSGPPGPTLTQPRTKCSTAWDNAQKSPPKTLAKAKGAGGEWWSDCTCPHSWYHPVQVSLFS